MKQQFRTLTEGHIRRYALYLQEQERSAATIRKYLRDLTALQYWLKGAPLTKCALIGWKEMLVAAHAPATVNSMLAAVNSFLAFMGWRELRVRPLRIQRALFRDAEKELTRTEYARLVRAAGRLGNERLCLVLQTLCATGIRVSELRCV